MSPTIASSLLPGKSFQAMVQEREIHTEPGGHTELKRQSWEFKETKADRVFQAGYCTGEGDMKKFLEFHRGQSLRDKCR